MFIVTEYAALKSSYCTSLFFITFVFWIFFISIIYNYLKIICREDYRE